MIVTEDLIRLIDRSEAERVAVSAAASGGDVIRVAGGVAAFCGEGNFLTQCAGVGLDGPVNEEEFEMILAHYRGRCSQFEFKLSVIADQSLRPMMVRKAVSLPEFEMLLAFDLSRPLPEVPDMDIRKVDDADLDEYAQRAAIRFNGPDYPPFLPEVLAASCRTGNSAGYEVYVDGIPVAGCGFAEALGVSWLAGAAVDPEYRGKGWHQAMQAFRLRLAAGAGCKIACQGALPGTISQQNAQKNGFEVVCTRPTFMVRA